MNSENKNINILVVDDEEIVVSLVCDTLEDEGFKVTACTDPLDAIKVVEQQSIDLLITDIRMPNMNGIDMVRRIHLNNPKIAIIFMTGYANLNSAKEAIKEGASDYILKPFELKEIRQAVYKAVDQIKKDLNASTSTKQLNNLSDLNEMLFTVGDKKSLTTVTIQFILNQCQSGYGALLNWNSDFNEFKMYTVNRDEADELILPPEKMIDFFVNMDLDKIKEPKIINYFSEHPFSSFCDEQTLKDYIFPTWFDESQPLMLIPVYRSLSIYGLLMIQKPDKTHFDEIAYLKFLQLTAHQLAISLENLDLLEESRSAYSKLQQLQDETIQLEKMTTQGEMSAEIGHELNNFLGVVTGNLSLLEVHVQRKNYDVLDKHIRAMNDNLGQMKKFTTNLMELRRISTQKDTINFSHLLNDVIEYLKPQKRYENVNLVYENESSELLFEADSTHIQQLLYNLLNNAADATIDCPLQDITVRTIKSTNNNFELTITDTGLGFEIENLQKAFTEKFTTKDTGHGFGLLVCKRIIESHAGTIDIVSEPGQGTTIKIEFPLAESSVTIPESAY